MTADSFDLAEKLQCPVIVMSDLDLGMNDNISLPLEWDDKHKYDRGKVLNSEQLDALTEKWGRYLDVDNDGICYRTYPGTHPELGAYFTRGSSHNEYAAYTEDNNIYKQGMLRLNKKWQTAKALVPKPHTKIHDQTASYGAIFFGTSTHSSYEAVEQLSSRDITINTLRLRGFPFQDEVEEFINNHEIIFIIEQNRDSQMRTLLVNECGVSQGKLFPVTSFDGMPITARHITKSIIKTIDFLEPSSKTNDQGGNK